mmetsp:Transcript_30655/g.72018  ORF Transcript_30655/g.72018 Transcript_30655/m.72018 type:complete len:221 (+) Transcript_30655:828-1490(+)
MAQPKKRKHSRADSLLHDEYVVEAILDERTSGGTRELLIKWVGYGDKDNTWEVEDDVHAPRLLKEFEMRRQRAHTREADRPGKGAAKKHTKRNHEDSAEGESAGEDSDEPERGKGDKESEEEEDDVYVVSGIKGVRVGPDGKRWWKLGWKGYAAWDDSWVSDADFFDSEMKVNYLWDLHFGKEQPSENPPPRKRGRPPKQNKVVTVSRSTRRTGLRSAKG